MSRTAKTSSNEAIHFESAITTLETLVEQMAKGNLSLEESLAHFEQGISLARQCQAILKTAEQKVEMLVSKQGETDFKTVPFTEDE